MSKQSPKSHAEDDRSSDSVTGIYRRLRSGDQDAVRELWDRFYPRLLALAGKTLSRLPDSYTDADDAVQSAFLNFWQRADRGDLPEDFHREDLWSLLAVTTVRRATRHSRRELAKKRGAGRVVSESAMSENYGNWFRLEDALSKVPSPEAEAHCEELLTLLNEKTRACVLLRLMGYKNEDIADVLDCSERSVYRRLDDARTTWAAATEP